MGGVKEVVNPSHAGETEVQALPHHHMSHHIHIYTDRVVVYKSHPVTCEARQKCCRRRPGFLFLGSAIRA